MKTLANIAEYVSEKINSNNISLEQYVTTDSLLQDKRGRELAQNLPPVNCALTKYQEGDVLVANIRPYLKKIWFANADGGCSSDVLVFRAKDGHTPNFLYSTLLEDRFYSHAMAGAKGSKMPRGDKDQIMRYKIPTSSKNEENIGNLIAHINNKLSISRSINQNLEAMAKQLYDYWFVQFDFPNEEGKPYKSSGGKMVWNEKLKREIPEQWTNKTLRELINLEDTKRIPLSTKEREERKGTYPYYGATGIMGYVNDYVVDGDYLLLAEDGSTSDSNGNPIVQYIWGKNWINNHAHIINPKSENQLYYFSFLLKSIPAVLIETGSIQKKISQDNLLSFYVVSPTESIVQRYSDMVNVLQEMRKSNFDNIIELTKQRDELLPLLMNGQVTVNSDLLNDRVQSSYQY